jgi:TM2 domain-containing membrane protein YozV
MYRIIGGDGREYGPASAEQVRDWVRQGRANAQTRIRAEAGGEWRTLAELEEFRAVLEPPPLGGRGGASGAGSADRIAAGVFGILLGGLGIHKFVLGYTGPGLILLLVTLLTCGVAWPVTHLIGLIEGILYLTKTDDEFVRTYVHGRKSWF